MHLDVTTLFVVIVFIDAIAGGLMLFSWLHSRTVTALLYWGAAYLMGAIAASLLGARDIIPDFWSIVVANAALLGVYGLTWCGVRNFDARPVNISQFSAGTLVWLLACCIPDVYDSIQARATVASAIATVYAGLVVRDLWRGRHDRLMSRWLFIGITAFQGAVYLSRGTGMWLIALPPGGGLLQAKWLPFGLFEGLFYSFCSAFVLLTMAKERAEARHKRAAFIDPLTGVANRRAFNDEAMKALKRCRDDDRPAMLLLFDLDYFKRINDTFGHQVGDDILVSFCRVVQARLDADDIFARLGGEEFACLLPDRWPQAAFAIAERIRNDFEARGLAEGQVRATVSVGMADSGEAGTELKALMASADKALYRAKSKGRNRVEGRRPTLSVVSFDTPVPRGAA